MNPPLIDIRNATVWRGPTRVFDGLTLRIEERQNTALLGPNGAGKTTLLKVLSRELYPVHQPGSHVRILGRDLFDVWAFRRQLGLVSEELQHAEFADVKGLEVVLSGYLASTGLRGVRHALDGEQIERARSLMAELGIGQLADVSMQRMSSGQRRRALLARALVHDPRALVLDEPTAGFDLKMGFEYQAIIKKLIAAGKTIVLATHHVNEIVPEMGRVVLLKEGRVFRDGEPDRVLTAENLSELYDTPVVVSRSHGHYLALPG